MDTCLQNGARETAILFPDESNNDPTFTGMSAPSLTEFPNFMQQRELHGIQDTSFNWIFYRIVVCIGHIGDVPM